MNSIKLNWGLGITALYLGFVALIITLVVGSMRQDFTLVSEDYYEQELNYQKVIDARQNGAALSAPVETVKTASTIVFTFPHEFSTQIISGNVQFYSAQHSEWDKTVPLTVAGSKAVVSRSILRPTTYMVRINWKASGKDFYQETHINLYK